MEAAFKLMGQVLLSSNSKSKSQIPRDMCRVDQGEGSRIRRGKKCLAML